MNIAYYPGCSLHGPAKEYDMSARLTCHHLGVKLQEVEDWNCCGATAAHSLNHELAISLSARNLSLVNQMSLKKVTTPCAGCFNRLKTASYEIRNSKKLAEKAGVIIGAAPPIEPEVSSLLQLMVEDVGYQNIANEVVTPLNGLQLAAYYGCLLTRPRNIANFDDSEQPMSMDKLLEALGAEVLVWGHKAECCGGGYAVSQTDIVIDLSGQVLQSAIDSGADAIVVACPMCQANLDMRQQAIIKEKGLSRTLPVVYFTQMMGLAFGYSSSRLGMKRLLNSPIPMLQAKGFI